MNNRIPQGAKLAPTQELWQFAQMFGVTPAEPMHCISHSGKRVEVWMQDAGELTVPEDIAWGMYYAAQEETSNGNV